MAALLVLHASTGKRLFSQGTGTLPHQWRNKDAFAAFCFSLYLQWTAVHPVNLPEQESRHFWCVQGIAEAEQSPGGAFFYVSKGYLCVVCGDIEGCQDCVEVLCSFLIERLQHADLQKRSEKRWEGLVSQATVLCLASVLVESGVDAYEVDLLLDNDGVCHTASARRAVPFASHASVVKYRSTAHSLTCRFSCEDPVLCEALMTFVESVAVLVV